MARPLARCCPGAGRAVGAANECSAIPLRPIGLDPPIDRSPSQWPLIDLGASAVQIAVGGHACALLEGGTVRCWGRAEFGQLGYGDRHVIGDDETPAEAGDVDVAGLVTARSPAVTAPEVLAELAQLGVEVELIERVQGRTRFVATLEAHHDLDAVVPLLERVEDLVGLDATNLGLSDLALVRRLTRLERLDLSGNPITDFKPLERLVSLQVLSLRNTPITGRDIATISALTELRDLDVSNTQIRPGGLPRFPELRRLVIHGVRLQRGELEEVESRFSRAEIVRDDP